MAKYGSDGIITFIPYLDRDKQSQQARKAQQSRIKRHAAIKSHPATRHQPWRLTVTEPAGGQRDWSGSEVVVKPVATNFRSKDWHFGSLGSQCRPMSNFELTIIREYVGRGSQLWRGMHFAGIAPSARPILRPLFEDLVRRAVNDTALLSSLVASTALLMADEYWNSQTLTASGMNVCKRLCNLFESHCSINVMLTPLKRSALAVGDTSRAHVHLNFLTKNVSRPHPQAKSGCEDLQQMHDRLLAQIRGCSFRLALETCSKPLGKDLSLQPLKLMSSQISEDCGCARHICDNNLSVFCNYRLKEDGSPDAGARCAALATAETTNKASARPHSGFLQAIDAGILSATIKRMIVQYDEALHYLSRVSAATREGREELVQAGEDCSACLHRLCTDWHYWHYVRDLSNDTVSTQHFNTGNLINMHKITLDHSLVLALQIHVGLCLGRYLPQTLPVLSDRLRSSLERLRPLKSAKTVLGTEEELSLQFRLLLWIFLMGILASGNNTKASGWFRIRAANLVVSLNIKSGNEMNRMLAHFGPADGLLADAFARIAVILIEMTATP